MTGAAEALDANFAELIRWYATRPGGAMRRDADVSTCSTGLGFRAVNGAVAIGFDPARADQRIAEVTEWFAARNGPWRWLVGPTSSPPDLGTRLELAGFELVSDTPGMALDLDAFVVPAPPDGLEIRPVVDRAGLAAWSDIQRRALALDPVRSGAWHDANDRVIEPSAPLRNWIALSAGEPVAASALFEGAGVAGVYNVGTVPEARGRGFGAAVTAMVLAEARARGLRLAVLGASELGYPVYRRLGFRDVSRLRSYALPTAAGGPATGPVLGECAR